MSRKNATKPARRPQGDKVARAVNQHVQAVQGLRQSGAAGTHRDARDERRGTKSSRGGRQQARRGAISQAW